MNRCMFVCLSAMMKTLFYNLYEYRTDLAEDLDLPREMIPWIPPIFSAIDLISTNLKKMTVDSIKDIPNDRVSEFLMYLCGLMSNEYKKEQSVRWLRVGYNLLELPQAIHTYWLQKLRFTVEDTKEHRRMVKNCEEFEAPYFKFTTCVFNNFRAMEIGDNTARNFLKNLSWLFKVFQDPDQKVSTRYEAEKVYLYLMDEIVTIILNQKSTQVVNELTKVLKEQAKKFRFSFSTLLSQAEKNNQPKRLTFLSNIWYEDMMEMAGKSD